MTTLKAGIEKPMVTDPESGKTYSVDRIIGEINGEESGPVVIFLGGVHGNEPAGVLALERVFEKLAKWELPIRGSIHGIAGNLKALARKERFIKEDLNRIWFQETIDRIRAGEITKESGPEREEQIEIWEIVENLLKTRRGPFFFIDLHTTSAPSAPFITFNDTLTNRKFSTSFPMPVILGIEEYLEGPLLSYINEIGHVAMAIESGQHDAVESVLFHEALIMLSLVEAGNIDKEKFPAYQEYYSLLSQNSPDKNRIFEIKYRYAIEQKERFQMHPGYKNFQPVRKKEELATSDDQPVHSHLKGRIFMPLYQSQGDDGYFLVRQVSRFWLKASATLRNIRFERVLKWLPGVRQHPEEEETLVVNRRVARFLATDLFHLLGFRRKRLRGKELWFSRRKWDLFPPSDGNV